MAIYLYRLYMNFPSNQQRLNGAVAIDYSIRLEKIHLYMSIYTQTLQPIRKAQSNAVVCFYFQDDKKIYICIVVLRGRQIVLHGAFESLRRLSL